MGKKNSPGPPVPMEVTPAMRRKWAAESTAQTMLDTAPKRKQALDHITRAVLAAGKKATREALKG